MGRETREMAVLFAARADGEASGGRLGERAAQDAFDALVQAAARVVAAHDGRFVRRFGDAALFVLDSADAALRAGCALQRIVGSAHRGDAAPGLRLGLHYGPVRGEVCGDTVDAAACLAAAASAGQILAAEAVFLRLAPEARAGLRALFRTVLKGSDAPSTIYEALWRAEDAELTTVNLDSPKPVPRDTGSLVVCYGARRLRVDQRHPSLSLGRSADCDIVVPDLYASRQHATIKLRRMGFYLLDHSTNGTYVSMRGEEVHVLRGELLLGDSGALALGRRPSAEAPSLSFERERRTTHRG